MRNAYQGDLFMEPLLPRALSPRKAAFEAFSKLVEDGELGRVKETLQEAPWLLDRLQHSRRKVTWLHFAVEKRQPDVLKWLLEVGMSVDAQDKEGQTPLIWAINRRDRHSTKILLEAGADPNAVCYRSRLALHQAAADPCPSGPVIVGLLLTHGAKVDCIEDFGETPLRIAAARDLRDTVVTLLGHGARAFEKEKLDVNDPRRNKNAVAAARASGYLSIAEIIGDWLLAKKAAKMIGAGSSKRAVVLPY